MGNLINDRIAENSWEAFEAAAVEDGEFRAELAESFLTPVEYYLLCKEGADHYLDDILDEVFGRLLKWDLEAVLRNPVEAARRYLSA